MQNANELRSQPASRGAITLRMQIYGNWNAAFDPEDWAEASPGLDQNLPPGGHTGWVSTDEVFLAPPPPSTSTSTSTSTGQLSGHLNGS